MQGASDLFERVAHARPRTQHQGSGNDVDVARLDRFHGAELRVGSEST